MVFVLTTVFIFGRCARQSTCFEERGRTFVEEVWWLEKIANKLSAKNSWRRAVSNAGLLKAQYYEVDALPSELAGPGSRANYLMGKNLIFFFNIWPKSRSFIHCEYESH